MSKSTASLGSSGSIGQISLVKKTMHRSHSPSDLFDSFLHVAVAWNLLEWFLTSQMDSEMIFLVDVAHLDILQFVVTVKIFLKTLIHLDHYFTKYNITYLHV